jgi:hypothetical protein
MRKFTWVVLTNCDPAHDTEFNEWYDGVHIGDLLRIPGVVSAVQCQVQVSRLLSHRSGGRLERAEGGQGTF